MNKNMRIAFMTEYVGLGGGETSLIYFLFGLANAGISILLIAPSGAATRASKAANIDVVELNLPDVHLRMRVFPQLSLRTIFKIVQILIREKVEVLQVESILGLIYGGIAARIANIPCVATYHGYWPIESWWLGIFLKIFCCRIYPVSKCVESDLVRSFPSIITRIRRIPLGLGSQFTVDLPSKDEIRNNIGLPIDRSIVMLVARFQSIKGHMLLLDSMENLFGQSSLRNPLLIFVGGISADASKDDHLFFEQIQKKTKNRQAKGDILFMGHRQDTPLIMKAADVVVVPSKFETFSMVTIEVLAVGTPLIATDCGGATEVLSIYSPESIVPNNDPYKLGDAIRQVLVHREEMESFFWQLRPRIIAEYSQEARLARALQEYSHLLEKRWSPKGRA